MLSSERAVCTTSTVAATSPPVAARWIADRKLFSISRKALSTTRVTSGSLCMSCMAVLISRQ